MLRVFKVTSPMSVGSWILLRLGGASNTAAALELLGILRPRQVARRGRRRSRPGPPLATYTGALIANTAIPVWSEARDELPWLFGASAAASAGRRRCDLHADRVPPGPARRAAVAGVALELGLMQAMEKRLGFVGEVYKQGEAGRYGEHLEGLHGRRRRRCSRWRGGGAARPRSAGGALVLAGELALRWSVFKAGFQSARDPRYTVLPQKERLQRRKEDGS